MKIQLGKKREYNYPLSIQEVDHLTGQEFESFIFNYLKEFQNYEGKITDKNDHGIDILLWRKDDHTNRFGAQCKRYGPKSILGENDLVKMQKGVDHYGLKNSKKGKPNLILFTSAEKKQISGRGIAYIENEEIEAYYREDIIEILKDLDEKLDRDVVKSNYSNIAFEASKKKGSFKEHTKFVEMLKKERMNISKYNKITPVYLVYNDKTIEDIILKKPNSLEALLEVKGIDEKKIEKFGLYLINRIRVFLNQEPLSTKKTIKVEMNKEDFTIFLKGVRKKIATYNKIDKLYNVFNNKTLEKIIEKSPRTKDELLEINGIGPVKSELWGEYLLKEIKKYLEK